MLFHQSICLFLSQYKYSFNYKNFETRLDIQQSKYSFLHYSSSKVFQLFMHMNSRRSLLGFIQNPVGKLITIKIGIYYFGENWSLSNIESAQLSTIKVSFKYLNKLQSFNHKECPHFLLGYIPKLFMFCCFCTWNLLISATFSNWFWTVKELRKSIDFSCFCIPSSC